MRRAQATNRRVGYRSNLGCLWLLLLLVLIGGSPLLVGVIRVLLGFVLATLLGGILLSMWMRRQAVLAYAASRGTDQRRFVELLVALLVRLATLDGDLDRREVTAIRHFFQHGLGYDGERLLWIRDLIKERQRRPMAAAEICREIAEKYDFQARFIVLQVLTTVASADAPTSAAEARFIQNVAARLGLGPFVGSFEWRGTGAQRPAPAADESIEQALAVLGLARGATAQDIKQAWRRLSLENHPDRVAHLGEEFRRLAEERMRKINAAHETLKEAGLAA